MSFLSGFVSSYMVAVNNMVGMKFHSLSSFISGSINSWGRWDYKSLL